MSLATAMKRMKIDDFIKEKKERYTWHKEPYGAVTCSQCKPDIQHDKRMKIKFVLAAGNSIIGKSIAVRGRVHAVLAGYNRTVLVQVREKGKVILCKVDAGNSFRPMAGVVSYAAHVRLESVVVVEGIVGFISDGISPQQQVGILVRCIFTLRKFIISRSLPVYNDIPARVQLLQDWENTPIPMPAPAVKLGTRVINRFTQYLLFEGFCELFTPKPFVRSCEGTKLDWKGEAGSLAGIPRLHMEMAHCSGYLSFFSVVPMDRFGFTWLDAEMVMEHKCPSELREVAASLFISIFNSLNEKCQNELEALSKPFPCRPLKYRNVALTFEKGIQMLQEAGVEVDPLGALSREAEMKLGQLVLEKHKTDFYILHRYPLAGQPFYTMPCRDNKTYANSFRAFLRGEEIMTGSQRVHSYEHLLTRAQVCGVDVDKISNYLTDFRHGAPHPHGGFSARLDRVVKLFCDLKDL